MLLQIVSAEYRCGHTHTHTHTHTCIHAYVHTHTHTHTATNTHTHTHVSLYDHTSDDGDRRSGKRGRHEKMDVVLSICQTLHIEVGYAQVGFLPWTVLTSSFFFFWVPSFRQFSLSSAFGFPPLDRFHKVSHLPTVSTKTNKQTKQKTEKMNKQIRKK